MTPAAILAALAGHLCAIGVGLLFAAIAVVNWRMPRQGSDAAVNEQSTAA
jgi:hypothetical protein